MTRSQGSKPAERDEYEVKKVPDTVHASDETNLHLQTLVVKGDCNVYILFEQTIINIGARNQKISSRNASNISLGQSIKWIMNIVKK